MTVSAFVIAGTHSGCGKTTVSLGIMAALARRGLTVQPFKVGPDFIDPGHHTLITGRPSHNLDGWMMERERNRQIFNRYTFDADVAVVEGVMGLFDGFSGKDETGSTAHMAKWLDLPVVLVIDAASMARSAAAIALGFLHFDSSLPFAGVILNRVAGPGHAEILKEAFESVPEVPILGCLQRRDNLKIPSRHLGLITVEDMGADSPQADELAQWIEEGVDLDGLLEKTRRQGMKGKESLHAIDVQSPSPHKKEEGRGVRIAIARDEAFCFYYQENLRLLQEAGAEIVPFSPLRDISLPPEIKGLILGGGYPELHVETLSRNCDLNREILRAALDGMPMYAECGGFMYLMEEIEDLHGADQPMVGVFPFRCRMVERLKALGYREVITEKDSILGPPGTTIRGHEFHYSTISKAPTDVSTMYRVSNRRGRTGIREGFQMNQVLGSYVHLHWGSNPAVAPNLVEYCRRYG